MVNTEGSELEKNGLISIYRASYNINVSIQKMEVPFFFKLYLGVTLMTISHECFLGSTIVDFLTTFFV